MTKKTWSLLGILLIAMLLLTACGSKPVSGKITLWHALKDTETAGLNAIIADFKAANPDTEFEVLFVPFDDLRNKFETAAATGGGPDLLIGGDDWYPPVQRRTDR